MPHKNKPLYFLAVNLLVLSGLLFLGWLAYEKISAASSLIKNAEAKIALLESKEKEFSRIAFEIESSEADVNKINAVFLNEASFVSFVELLESLAREAGVSIKSESARLPQGKEAANIQFAIEGNFPQIIKFLALLDKIPTAGIITGIEITGVAGRASEEKIPADSLIAKASYTILSFRKQ